MSKPSLAEFVPLAFIQETGSVIQWFKMPKEDRLNYWKASIKADHKDTTEPRPIVTN